MIDNLTGMERRLTLRMLAYWEKMRKNRPMPGEEDINSDDISDLWDRCFLIRVKDLEKPDYNYTYLGGTIARAYCHDLEHNGPPSQLISPHADRLAQSYASVIATGKPLLDEGEFHNLHGELVKYRQCLLPLGRGKGVDAIFGGMSFKIFVS